MRWVAITLVDSVSSRGNRVCPKTYPERRWPRLQWRGRLYGTICVVASSPLSSLGLLGAVACLAGCGLQVRQPDLFLLKRTGNGATLTELVNTGGTVRCDGSKAKQLPDKVLLKARNLSGRLNRDARHHLNLPSPPDSVYRYRVKLQDGTIAFPDTAARTHSELAQLELLAVSIAQGPCQGAAPSR